MKIVGMSTEYLWADDMYRVTVTALVPKRHDLEADDVAALLDALKEASGSGPASRDTKDAALDARLRGGSAASHNQPPTDKVLEDKPVQGLQTRTPDPLPQTGRRRGSQEPASQSSAAPAETTPSEPAAAATPASSGRRRGGSAPQEVTQGAPANPPPEATPAASAANTGRRRGSNAPSVETKSPSEGAPKISDRDMVKAASAAAERLGTPEPVQILLGGYGVENVNQISQEQRQEFLDTVAGLGQ